jgi:hypothetical protein
MKENTFPKDGFGGKIEKVRIPDSDMTGWSEILRAENFSEKEVDAILSHLNLTYRDMAHPNWIEKELEWVEGHLKKDHGKNLTEDQKERFRQFARRREK